MTNDVTANSQPATVDGSRSQPRVDRLALHREDSEDAFVNAVERLAAHVERLDAEPELADGYPGP